MRVGTTSRTGAARPVSRKSSSRSVSDNRSARARASTTRRRGSPSLLQPGQVVHRDAGEPGELLATQPGSAPTATDGTPTDRRVGARFVQLDVTDDGSVAAAFAQIEAGGGLDVLVNNAGIGMLALNGPDALRVFDTNGVGIIRVIEAALPLLRRSENPVVVNISSALGPFWANHEPSRPASKVSAIVYGAVGDDTRAGATVHETSCDLASLADVRAAAATGRTSSRPRRCVP